MVSTGNKSTECSKSALPASCEVGPYLQLQAVYIHVLYSTLLCEKKILCASSTTYSLYVG
jgi:hypothetical protein